MFLLYYLWNFSTYIVYFNLNFINYFFLKFNRFNLIFKKSFNRLTYLEKLFLILFNRKNWFTNSFCCFSDFDNEIFKLRNDKYPFINFLYVFNLKSNNEINYDFFKKFYNKINSIDNTILNNFQFNVFELLVLQKIFYKKYFNLLNLFFFKNINFNNLIKINFIIFYFLILNGKNKKINLYNLNYYNNWYEFTFFENKTKQNSYYLTHKIKLNKILFNKFKKNKINYIKKVVIFYNKMCKFNNKSIYTNIFYINIMTFGKFFKFFKNNFLKNLKFKPNYLKNLKFKLPIRFSDSSLNKYINFNNFNNYNFYYLRKNRIFNKGRYSRNRQLYRTGVYWCLWLNIIIVYGLYFFFYRFTFNFGYFWIGLSILIFSTIFSRICKYNFFNIFTLYKEFNYLYYWFGFLFLNFLKDLKIILNNFIKNNNLLLILFNRSNYILYKFYFSYKKIFIKFNKKKDYGFVFIWENYRYNDNSFLKYKSILNWFFQLYKVLTY